MARVDLKDIPLQKSLGKGLIREIEKLVKADINIMEVCGSHTTSIFKAGLRKRLPERLKLLSGPGCPVCVSEEADIDRAIALAKRKEVIILTFGDMMPVPGSKESLAEVRAEGGNIQIIYSPLEALNKAEDNPEKKVILLAVGFETTAPSVAATVLLAKKKKLKNLFIFSLFKLIPEAMTSLLDNKENNISGFISPGHVSTIIGSKPYQKIASRYKIPCVITGFEPLDILEGILRILRQKDKNISKVEIQYRRCVRPEGNIVARRKIEKVFKKEDVSWRGLGMIPRSGLKLRGEFSSFDAEKFLPRKKIKVRLKANCLCGEVLRGIITPKDCPQFRKGCTPPHPLGPCMVSREGTCAAYFWYDK